MKRINLAAIAEWDELELLSAEAGRCLREGDTEGYRRVRDSAPALEFVEVTTGQDFFSVTPGPGQARDQLTLGSLYHKVRYLGWRVSNLIKRFDPMLAAHVSKHYGARRLRYRSSWFKVTVPETLIVRGEQQRHRDTVRYMIEAVAQREPVMDIRTFWELSARSLARAMPEGEARQYLEEGMGVR